MKLLLINTPISIRDTLGNFGSVYDDLKMVPTGIAYLAAFVRQAGIEVRILDQYAECLLMDEVVALIEEFDPDLIGLSATTPNYFAAIAFTKAIKRKFPEIPTVLGGYHPSVLPRETLQERCVDYVIRDEAEYSLLRLCEALDGGDEQRFGNIHGLSYKTDSGQVHNEKTKSLKLDDMPFPAYDLLPMHLYSSPSFTKFASPVYQMIASRGCPFSCTYCINAELNVSAKYRRRSIKSVADEMEFLIDKFGAKQIQFWDPIFPLGQKHAFEFCEEIMRRSLQNRVCWNSGTRADSVTEEMIEIMVAAGCKGIGFGIESGVPELLRSVNKKLELNKVGEVCKIARKKGLVVAASFIIGFPGETTEMTKQTIDFAKSLDIHYAQFSIMVPYPGTPLFDQLKADGEIPDVRENDFSCYNQNIGNTNLDPVFVPKGRTADELKKLQKKAYVEFYMRPKIVLMHLRHINASRLKDIFWSFFTIVKLAILLKMKRPITVDKQ